jgi:putative transposase
MKLTLQTQLLPDKEQSEKLKSTVEQFNEAANWLAEKAFALKTANKVKLQQIYYYDLREKFGLSAQMAVRCIAQVCEAYSRDKARKPGFRKHAAVPYDERLMSFKGLDKVSLLTLDGRVIVPLVMGKYQSERFNGEHRQCDLVLRKDGKWFLLVVVELPDGAPTPTTDFIGIDLGVASIATDSDGLQFSGEQIEQVRQKYTGRRTRLQRAAARRRQRGHRPKAIRRKLKGAANKESRFRRDTNHIISKKLVEKATDTGRGIALEDLSGIRDRARFRKTQRARMSGWSFYQLRTFIEYKAKIAGMPVVTVDPRNTSRTCSQCGHCEKGNRLSQSEFRCRSCGFELHADINAALNIKARASVIAPMVSEQPQIAAA